MKKLELQNFGVVEMNNDEMREVVGGSWFSRNWKLIGYAVVAVIAVVGLIIEDII